MKRTISVLVLAAALTGCATPNDPWLITDQGTEAFWTKCWAASQLQAELLARQQDERGIGVDDPRRTEAASVIAAVGVEAAMRRAQVNSGRAPDDVRVQVDSARRSLDSRGEVALTSVHLHCAEVLDVRPW